MASTRRILVSPEIEAQLLRLAKADKISEAMPTLAQALNMYELLQKAQAEGSKFYEVDKNGEKYIVKFV